MADPAHLAMLEEGVDAWNRWRDAQGSRPVDLSGADLTGRRLNYANLLRADLSGTTLTQAQLEHAHLKEANLTGAVLHRTNFEHVNARGARFDDAEGIAANFEVATIRGAHLRRARLPDARFHRAYLRDADLTGATLTGAWLRFATFEGAHCKDADFSGADLRYASLVNSDLCGAKLVDVQAYGVSAWNVTTDSATQQELLVSVESADRDAPLRAHDLQTAQLLALMLDGTGVRDVVDSVSSKLVLVLGSFSPEDKPVLDALRDGLQRRGYVAVTFDFERPAARDYAETVVVLAGLSRFVVGDFTHAKEIRAEVQQARRQYPRVPIVPILRRGAQLPVTAVNDFSVEDLKLLVRYDGIDDLLAHLQESVIEPAEARARQIAAALADAEAIVRGT